MTPQKLLECVKDRLQNLTYIGTSTKIFFTRGVRITSEVPIEQLSQFQDVQCFLVDTGDINHREHPGIIFKKFSVVIFLENLGDEFGENTIVGGNGKQGVKEIERVVTREMMELVELEGERLTIQLINTSRKKYVSSNTPTITTEMNFEVMTEVYN